MIFAVNFLLFPFHGLKVEVVQYDNPIQCYSNEVLAEMSEKGTWKLTPEQVSLMPPEPPKFTPQNSAVLAVLQDHKKGNTVQNLR